MKKVYISALALTLFSFGLDAQTRYVATSGNDASNDCTNSASPCKTMNAALVAASPNDSIVVSAGTYNLSNTLNINKEGIVLTSLDTEKPVIEPSTSTVMQVSAKNVEISNFVFNMGLTSGSGMDGILGTAGYDSLKVLNNEFYSTKSPGFLSQGMVFNASAINLKLSGSDSSFVTINNNIINVAEDGNDIFGRGIRLGASAKSPAGIADGNSIAAFYPIQLSPASRSFTFTNDTLQGLTMIGYGAVGATVTFDGNVFDATTNESADKLYTLLDIRGNQNANFVISNNQFINFQNTGILAMASKNVSVVGNTFTPLSTADEYACIDVNTKLMTSGTQSNTYPSEISILGNTFNAGVAEKGTGIIFSDHYGALTPAFGNVVIGDSTQKNTFDTDLGYYIVLDSLSGSSDQVQLWNPAGFGSDHTPATTMKPVTQDFVALASENNYNFATAAEIENKMLDTADNAILGDIIIGHISEAGITDVIPDFITAVFPNPATSSLNFQANENLNNAKVQIIDVLGNVVYNGKINANNSISVANFKKGVYFLRIQNNAKTFTTKFIKK